MSTYAQYQNFATRRGNAKPLNLSNMSAQASGSHIANITALKIKLQCEVARCQQHVEHLRLLAMRSTSETQRAKHMAKSKRLEAKISLDMDTVSRINADIEYLQSKLAA